jgi:hypothetical protein
MVAATISAAVCGAAVQKQAVQPKAFDRAAMPYRAYWLTRPLARGEAQGYRWLLVTRGAIHDLAGQKKWSDLPFDNVAISFRTYEKDSLWSHPFSLVQQFGPVSADEKTGIVDGVTYNYEPCPLKDVVRLLENPLGTIAVHRGPHRLAGVERTARAFRLLLLEQMKNEKSAE